MRNRNFVPTMTDLEPRIALSGIAEDPTDPIPPPHAITADYFPYPTPRPPFSGKILSPPPPPPGTPPPPMLA